MRNGSTVTELNGKPFILWSKTSGITFLIVFNAPTLRPLPNRDRSKGLNSELPLFYKTCRVPIYLTFRGIILSL